MRVLTEADLMAIVSAGPSSQETVDGGLLIRGESDEVLGIYPLTDEQLSARAARRAEQWEVWSRWGVASLKDWFGR